MLTRGILVHPQELDTVWLEEAAALGLNVIGLHPVGGRAADQSLDDLLRSRDRLAPMLDRARSMGIRVEYEMHALSRLLPRAGFAKHPEWFRMDENGERRADFNMCCANGEALSFLAERACELTKELPSDTHRYYYWPDDVTEHRCHCAYCRSLSASDRQTIMMNAMLSGIRKADPAGRLAWLSYQDTLVPPEKIKPDKGLFLEYAPIRRSPDHCLWDRRVKRNRGELRYLEDMLRVFDVREAKVLEYWTDNSLLSNWTKPPRPFTLNASVMERDLRGYAALGFTSVTAFGCYLGSDYRARYGMPDLSAYGRLLRQY